MDVCTCGLHDTSHCVLCVYIGVFLYANVDVLFYVSECLERGK